MSKIKDLTITQVHITDIVKPDVSIANEDDFIKLINLFRPDVVFVNSISVNKEDIDNANAERITEMRTLIEDYISGNIYMPYEYYKYLRQMDTYKEEIEQIKNNTIEKFITNTDTDPTTNVDDMDFSTYYFIHDHSIYKYSDIDEDTLNDVRLVMTMTDEREIKSYINQEIQRLGTQFIERVENQYKQFLDKLKETKKMTGIAEGKRYGLALKLLKDAPEDYQELKVYLAIDSRRRISMFQSISSFTLTKDSINIDLMML